MAMVKAAAGGFDEGILTDSMLALAMGCGSLHNGKTVEASAATTERVVVAAVL